jgi:diguanylate cyclase (GGDEF)-like protein
MDNSKQEQQRILVVDDERINRKVLTDLLQDDYHVIIAKSGEQALQRLNDDPSIDLILLDVLMPEMNGYAVLNAIKANPKTKDILVIFITALSSLDDEELGLKLGANDYISKPFRPSIVKARIENYLQIMRHRKFLEVLAERDGLTGICNRRRFDELLQNEWQRSLRENTPFSLIMLDVDYFKRFNDGYGHIPGDGVLKNVAKTIAKQLRRPADVVARYGGEEFVILLPNTERDGAKLQAENVLNAIVELKIPHHYSDVNAFVTVSMGGATRNPKMESAQQLLASADAALYEAKQQGRNRVAWHQCLGS